jgi:hypothetical protein
MLTRQLPKIRIYAVGMIKFLLGHSKNHGNHPLKVVGDDVLISRREKIYYGKKANQQKKFFKSVCKPRLHNGNPGDTGQTFSRHN